MRVTYSLCVISIVTDILCVAYSLYVTDIVWPLFYVCDMFVVCDRYCVWQIFYVCDIFVCDRCCVTDILCVWHICVWQILCDRYSMCVTDILCVWHNSLCVTDILCVWHILCVWQIFFVVFTWVLINGLLGIQNGGLKKTLANCRSCDHNISQSLQARHHFETIKISIVLENMCPAICQAGSSLHYHFECWDVPGK